MTETSDSEYKLSADKLATCLGEMLCMEGNQSVGPSIAIITSARLALQAYRRKDSDRQKKWFKTRARHNTDRGIDPAWYGREVNGHEVKYNVPVPGRKITATYTICGLNLSRPVNCVRLVSKGGKFSWVSPEWVAERLGERVELPPPPPRKRAIQL